MNASLDAQFVDTHILVYAHDVTAGPKHARAKELINALWDNQMGCLSMQVLQEFYVISTRKVAQPLTAERAAAVIAELAAWRVHRPAVDDILDAIALQRRYGISFWDAMILQSALQLGCTLVWSEDLNSGQTYAGVQVANPFVRPDIS